MSSIKFHGGDNEGVFIVETFADANTLLRSHKHTHPHLSVLVSGTADVTIDGKTERLSGYQMLTIPANTKHQVIAITNIVWLCIWKDNVDTYELAKESLKLIKA